MVVAGLVDKLKEYQVAVFWGCMGVAGREIINGLPFEQEEDRNEIGKVLTLPEAYSVGKVNMTYEQ